MLFSIIVFVKKCMKTYHKYLKHKNLRKVLNLLNVVKYKLLLVLLLESQIYLI